MALPDFIDGEELSRPALRAGLALVHAAASYRAAGIASRVAPAAGTSSEKNRDLRHGIDRTSP
jgi:hypothetical protein